MESEQSTTDSFPQPGATPLPAAVRQRLQKVFEHAQRCVEKNDHDYAHQLLAQCVVEDPANLVYLQSFFANLEKKYGGDKKGAKLAGLKIRGHRSTLAKAAAKGDWPRALEAGCAALALNPWDVPTLLAMAKACDELAINENQLFLLRWALDVDSKDVAVNRHAALTLQRIGQFDQAIACWRRVEQAHPQDEEAVQAISRLSVEKAIHDGGYDPALLSGQQQPDALRAEKASVARLAKDAAAVGEAGASDSPEQRLQAAIEADPANVENYLQLADRYLHDERLDEAERLLGRGQSAAGGGDLRIRERLEEIQVRRARRQMAIAEQRCQQEPTEENQQLAAQLRNQANQVELEIFAAKSEREPQNSRWKYELGIRLKRAGKIRQAITALQAARCDSQRLAQVLVDLGECFQKIEQYKLALSNYEQAIEACVEQDSDIRRLALYRAGVLATGLRELDRAERHLTELADLDFGYRDVADRLDKINQIRDKG